MNLALACVRRAASSGEPWASARAMRSSQRRGSAYVVVLGTAMIVSTIGLTALLALRVERRTQEDDGDLLSARLNAKAAIEVGMQRIVADANWRTIYPSGVWEASRRIGSGSYTLSGVDPYDGDLADMDIDPLVLSAAATAGRATHQLQVTLYADVAPIDALKTAIHAGSIRVMGGKSLTATGASVSTNGLLQLDGGATVTGDVQAASLSNGGTITGTTTVPAVQKAMPDADVFAKYVKIATAIAAPNTIDRQVLAPGYNPWGPTNPDGVYLISMAGGTLSITNTRIYGTLLVDIPGGKVVLDQAVLLQNYRSNFPALIVNGNVELLFPTQGNSLSEVALGTNFNPPGAPYLNVTDSANDDTYASEIQGLAHVTGTLRLKTTATVRGVIICEGAVTSDDNNAIVYDANLYTDPPMGYTTPPVMKTMSGSWKQVVP